MEETKSLVENVAKKQKDPVENIVEKNNLDILSKKYTFSLIVEKNCEDLCIGELKQRFKILGTKCDGFVDFSATIEVALKVAYFSQSAKNIIFKIGSNKFEDLEDLTSKVKSLLKKNPIWQQLLSSKYRVSCTRLGAHDFNSVIVEQEISGIIKEEIESSSLVAFADYNTRDLVFFITVVDEEFLLGVDFAGKDLSKRHYLFFNNPNAIKGTLGFNLLLFSGFKPGKVLLDPFSLAGVIPIEAALYERGLSIHFFAKDFNFPLIIKDSCFEILKKFDEEPQKGLDNIFSCDPSFPNLASQKKNSRIAGVERYIAFARVDLRNLDIKNFKKEIDVICSRIIEPSKKVPESKVQKAYDDFFFAAKELLSKKGSINVIIRVPQILEEAALKHGFVVKEIFETAQGQQQLFFVKLMKK